MTPTLGLLALLIVTAFICTVLHIQTPSKCPLWVPVFIVIIVLAIMVIPK